MNNAYAGTVSPAMSMSPEDILHTFGVCVFGPIYLMQAAYPHMTRGGRIINIGSEASRLGNVPIYSAVKAAMDSLTFSLSKEVRQYFYLQIQEESRTCVVQFSENSLQGTSSLIRLRSAWPRWKGHHDQQRFARTCGNRCPCKGAKGDDRPRNRNG